jgi:hypothetical protein
MLSNITLSNKCFLPIPDSKLKSIHTNKELNIYDVSIGPIRVQSRKYSLAAEIGNNDLVVNIDGKDHICTNLTAIFSPGKTPTKFKLDGLEEITWDSKEVENNKEAITLEIGAEDPTTYRLPEKNKDAVLSGWDLGPIKINDLTMPSVLSLELFTEDTVLKARMVFAVDHIKFTGINVDTETTYYVKPD